MTASLPAASTALALIPTSKLENDLRGQEPRSTRKDVPVRPVPEIGLDDVVSPTSSPVFGWIWKQVMLTVPVTRTSAIPDPASVPDAVTVTVWPE